MIKINDFLVKDLIYIDNHTKVVGKEVHLLNRIRYWQESDRFDHLKEALVLVNLQGHYLEFGVATGKTINFIAERIGSQVIHGFDSFDGLPEDWKTERQLFSKGSFYQDSLPQVADNVELIIGLFENTLPSFSKDITTTAFLHIDCDLYSSTKTVFEHIGHTLKEGSIIVFDEYHVIKDEHTAFKEWLSNTNFSATMVVRTLGPQQVTFILKEKKI